MHDIYCRYIWYVLVRGCTFGTFWYLVVRLVRFGTLLYVWYVLVRSCTFGAFWYVAVRLVRFGTFWYIGMPRRIFWYEAIPRGNKLITKKECNPPVKKLKEKKGCTEA
jgi:hypothetical protein